ncbi:hypothetical protein LguiB_036081 [Lonicera macranthoides]
MNLSRWRKGVAMDSYGASRNKQIQSDDEFLRGPRKSKDPFIDDAFRRQQAVADKAPFPKSLGKRRGQGVERLILMSGLFEYEPGARIPESEILYFKCKSTFLI